MTTNKPKVLIFDIETAPMLAYVWSRRDVNIGLDMLKSEWYVMAWAAKWLGDPASKVMYQDLKGAKDPEDDRPILKTIWKLLDDADIVITQNGMHFDSRKLNARFIMHGWQPPSRYRHIDTYKIMSRVADCTSNKLEYLTEKLCKRYKKLKHSRFPGMSLWKECLKGNPKAWAEMKRYNIHDVLSTEELYTKIQTWDNSIDFNVYGDMKERVCNCGAKHFISNGFQYTNNGKFLRHRCTNCGKSWTDRTNLLTNVQRKQLAKSGGGW